MFGFGRDRRELSAAEIKQVRRRNKAGAKPERIAREAQITPRDVQKVTRDNRRR
jgi:hypothetical protein